MASWRVGSLENTILYDNLTERESSSRASHSLPLPNKTTVPKSSPRLCVPQHEECATSARPQPFRCVAALRASALRSITLSVNALPAASIFRALQGLRKAAHAPRNDSDHAECWIVYLYTTLWIVFLVTSSGRGRAYWIFTFSTGKCEFRLTSAAEKATAKKNSRGEIDCRGLHRRRVFPFL